jgi:hypothetical protein
MGKDWDPDIAALKLSDVEKNGLQVHRNYSIAFDIHRNKDFAAEVDNGGYKLDQLGRIQELILKEDPRFLAVIVSAFVDEQLDEMYRREIPQNIPGGRSTLFSGFGPLSRFSQRIQVAYAFDWLSRDLLTDVDKLRKLRNDVSHNWNIGDLTKELSDFISSSMSPIEAQLDDGMGLPKEFQKTLDEIALFRVRLVWIVGRLYYESLLFPRALKERLKPESALYGADHPQLLTKVAGLCVDATKSILKQVQSNPTADSDARKSGARGSL